MTCTRSQCQQRLTRCWPFWTALVAATVSCSLRQQYCCCAGPGFQRVTSLDSFVTSGSALAATGFHACGTPMPGWKRMTATAIAGCWWKARPGRMLEKSRPSPA